MKRFELTDGKSNKFWEIEVEGASFTVRYGRIGASGQASTKTFDSAETARLEADKLIASKIKKGYAPVTAGQSAAPVAGNDSVAGDESGNPELERAIVADPSNVEAWQVYGDWLQEKGDPRGELIALELAGKTDQAEALLEAKAEFLLGPLADHQKTYDGEDTDAFTWKHGFIHALRLSHDHYANEDFEGSLADVLDLVLHHPSGRFLSEITFVFNNDPNEDNLQNLIDLLAEQERPTIRKLHFGDFGYCGPSDDTATGETEISWYSIGDLSKLWPAVPNLRKLITQCGSADSTISGVGMTLGTLDLPQLVHAEFRTGGLEQENAVAIAKANIPNIERLDIWYGDESYGGDASADDVQLLLDRDDLPRLRHLGLKNAMFTDELPDRLAESKLIAQLAVLDLSMGCLTDEGAQRLARHADSFKHLESLDVSENYLTDAGLAALREALPNVVSTEQRELEEPDYRSTAVAE